MRDAMIVVVVWEAVVRVGAQVPLRAMVVGKAVARGVVRLGIEGGGPSSKVSSPKRFMIWGVVGLGREGGGPSSKVSSPKRFMYWGAARVRVRVLCGNAVLVELRVPEGRGGSMKRAYKMRSWKRLTLEKTMMTVAVGLFEMKWKLEKMKASERMLNEEEYPGLTRETSVLYLLPSCTSTMNLRYCGLVLYMSAS